MMTVRGLFPEIAVTGAVDMEDPENSSIEAVIQTASIRTHTRPGTTTSAPPTVWESKLLGVHLPFTAPAVCRRDSDGPRGPSGARSASRRRSGASRRRGWPGLWAGGQYQRLQWLLTEIKVLLQVAKQLSLLPYVGAGIWAPISPGVDALAVQKHVLDELGVPVVAERLVVDVAASGVRADHQTRHS